MHKMEGLRVTLKYNKNLDAKERLRLRNIMAAIKDRVKKCKSNKNLINVIESRNTRVKKLIKLLDDVLKPGIKAKVHSDIINLNKNENG